MRSVRFDNRRRVLDVEYASGKHVAVRYGQLGITKKISEAWIDRETGRRTIVLRFQDGQEEYIPYDQPLAMVGDPEYLLRAQIERLLARIRQALAAKHISTRRIARQLSISDDQVQRLLDPTSLNKNLQHLHRVVLLLGLELEWQIRDAA